MSTRRITANRLRRTAAAVLRESKVLTARGKGLVPAELARLDAFVAKLSEPAIVSQLLQSLDETPSLAGEAEVAEVLRELRGTALEPVLSAIPVLASPALKPLLEGVADRLASSHTDEVLRGLLGLNDEDIEAARQQGAI